RADHDPALVEFDSPAHVPDQSGAVAGHSGAVDLDHNIRVKHAQSNHVVLPNPPPDTVSSAGVSPVLEIQGLQKAYRTLLRRSRVALDGLDMVVDRGDVHGFLGPNGSGKSTTLKILLGLVRADAGRIRMLERPVPQSLPEVVPRVGAIVEAP